VKGIKTMLHADKVLDIMREVLRKSGKTTSLSKVDTQTDVLAEGFIDSLGLMDVMLEVERQFGISIPPARLSGSKISSAAKISATIEDLVEKAR
jgi:acyl carrier protein